MRPVNRGLAPKRPDGSPYYYENYGALRLNLIARLGEYCSYCEVPLGVDLAVEHMVAKSLSLKEVDWNNLLLACTNCNSRKGDKVNDANFNNYYWPSIRATSAPLNTFDMLQYRKANLSLQSLITDGLLSLPKDRAKRPYVQGSYDMVWVFVHQNYVNSPVAAKIKQTIVLTGLNDYIPDSENPKVSDRRIVNRTLAWDRAVLSANTLSKYYQPYNAQYAAAGNDQQRNAVVAAAAADRTITLLKSQIKALAVATGFWSIWVTIFQNPNGTFINDAVRQALICELFVKPFVGTYVPFSGVNACP